MRLSVALINLDRDVDRLAHMRTQCDRAGLSFERMPAIKGAELPESLKPFFEGSEKAQGALSAGEIGCYASHLALMQRLAVGEIKAPLLVLEDDIEFPADFATLLEAVLKELPAGWDIVRLTSTPKRAYVNLTPLPGDRALVRYSLVPGSTGGYLISAQGARKMLKPLPRFLPVDQDLKRLWFWGLDTYGVSPAPIRRDIFEVSSIDAMAPKDHRVSRARLERLRRGRMADSAKRHAWNLRLLGFSRWLGCEALNAALLFTPKRARPAALARGAQRLQLSPQ